jgi:hypothetical protein
LKRDGFGTIYSRAALRPNGGRPWYIPEVKAIKKLIQLPTHDAADN